ncbi:MAG: phosphomannose isomerase type II C-terminal cupin domain [Vampirovibrionales bacterium]|nr:phosphomannose isomerase type II C-terminal cupin domain [Vampirovibrionales bacterium]
MTATIDDYTYYATPDYQVSLRAVKAGETLTLSHKNACGLWLPITPGLMDENGPVDPGRVYSWDSRQAEGFERKSAKLSPALINSVSETVEVLELAWMSVAPSLQKPLAEVTETRPWGGFTVLADEAHFKLKQLWVTPGNRLSLQRHQQREEHWFVTVGQPEITLNDKTLNPCVGDYIHIPLQAWHRLSNPATQEVVEIIELQLGTYFGEDDIERQSDDYGRQ